MVNTDEASMLEMVLGGTMDTGYASVPLSSAKGPAQVQHLLRTQVTSLPALSGAPEGETLDG